MATTRSLIAKYIVDNTSTAKFSITSIPQTYTDLEIYCHLNYSSSTTTNNFIIRPNANTTAANYATEYLTYFYNNGIFDATNGGNSFFYFQYAHGGTGAGNGLLAFTRVFVAEYTQATFHNIGVVTSSTTTALSSSLTGTAQKQYKEAAAITSMEFDAGGGLWEQGSSVFVYGLLHY